MQTRHLAFFCNCTVYDLAWTEKFSFINAWFVFYLFIVPTRFANLKFYAYLAYLVPCLSLMLFFFFLVKLHWSANITNFGSLSIPLPTIPLPTIPLPTISLPQFPYRRFPSSRFPYRRFHYPDSLTIVSSTPIPTTSLLSRINVVGEMLVVKLRLNTLR